MPVSVPAPQRVPRVCAEGGAALPNKARQSWNLWKKTHGHITLTLAKQHRNPQLATCNSNSSQQFWVIRMRNWTTTQEMFLLLVPQRMSKLRCIFFFPGYRKNFAGLSLERKSICILAISKCYWKSELLGDASTCAGLLHGRSCMCLPCAQGLTENIQTSGWAANKPLGRQ